MKSTYCVVGVILCVAFALSADRAQAAGEPGAAVEFNRDIRPILSDKCFACHGFSPKLRKGKLRLDTVEGATADRTNGPAIVPGNLEKSELWARINEKDPDDRMPPAESHKTLSETEKQTLRRWIEQGAKYQLHWSFEPIAKPDVPQAAVPAQNPIDAFMRSRLESEGLKPAAEADRETLIRRVSFTLTGLPPAPQDVDAYLADSSPDAYEKMVDGYLASPRYGEEMARYWLDVARYADTHGLHFDNEREIWGYRDWVINAFNANKPYDRFTVEQLAGDLLPDAAHPAPTKEQLAATGFNRCNVTTSEGGAIGAEYLYRYAVDRTSTTFTAFMGLTGGCAVCHDHKFDPILTRDFYSMYAFFNSNADPALDGNAMLTKPVVRLSPQEIDRKIAALDASIDVKQKELDKKTAELAYLDPASIEPKPPIELSETVWLDDAFPAGADVRAHGSPTKWVTAAEGGQVFSGQRALKRTDKGLAQDYYERGAAPLVIPADGEIFAYVYLDPADPPKAIMLQFHTSGWLHRAVWGDYDAIQYGTPDTTEKVHMGPLPDTSKWERLEVPVEKIGLKPGNLITGFAFTQFGGTVYWDKLGVTGRTDRAADPTHSLLAWWKPRIGKTTPDVPPEIGKLLKEGPARVKKPAELKVLRNYYLQNVCADTRDALSPLARELSELRQQRDALDKSVPSTLVYTDLPTPRDSFIMIRGQYDKPGDKVEPGTPAFLPPLQKADPRGRATRLDLANWLVSRENPLTARVTVNRFWQQVFGVGLVKSSGDFGSQGEPPTHPQLLDWLASHFRDSGWDTKALIRLMVTSQTFRQSSAISPGLLERDPENRLLARGPRFRLDAEQIRDNALFVGGLINLEMGGRGARTYQPANIWEPVGY
jgi:hypothetical protein